MDITHTVGVVTVTVTISEGAFPSGEAGIVARIETREVLNDNVLMLAKFFAGVTISRDKAGECVRIFASKMVEVFEETIRLLQS